METKRSLRAVVTAVFLCLCLLLPVVKTDAAGGKTVYINGESVHIRKEATTKSTSLGKVSFTYATLNAKVDGQEAVSGSGTSWYNITCNGITGYVYGMYVTEISDTPVGDFDSTLNLFPESYRAGLTLIHSVYPNWQFVPEYLNITLDQAVECESGRKLISKSIVDGDENLKKEWAVTDTSNFAGKTTLEPGYYYATNAAIKNYMSPQNFLDTTYVFVFMPQAFDPNLQNTEGLKTVVKDTFLDNDTHISMLMNAGKDSGVSPYVLAATIISEQGANGGSNSLVAGYSIDGVKYYNYFNFGASGSTKDEIRLSGAQYAKSRGWDSPAASITGGAKMYSNGYISNNQDNYYYTNFNVKNITEADVASKTAKHQYASNLNDSGNKAFRLSKSFVTNTQSSITFRIPVYKGEGGTPGNPSTPSSPTSPSVKKGDPNNDGTINALDLAAVKKHILGVASLSGDGFNAADVTGDSKINALDLAAIKKHILGLATIS